MSRRTVLLSAAFLSTAGALVLSHARPVQAAEINDVFYIALENHNFIQPSSYTGSGEIAGNAAAPYLNSLITPGNPNAALTSYASNYVNVPVQPAGSPSGAGAVHPSEPNYVWAEAGVAGARNDSDPYGAGISNNPATIPVTNPTNNVVNAPSLSAQLQQAGISWKSYQEDTQLRTVNGQLTSTPVSPGQVTVPLASVSGTSPAYTNEYNGSNQYNYAAKHNPQLFFAATNGPASAGNYAPLQSLATDLATNSVARYNWITPDQYNDMHTALTGGFTDPRTGIHYAGDSAEIAQGDYFLSLVIPEIEASAAFKNNGEIVIWNDETEGEGNGTPGFTGTDIVISPLAKGNAYTNSILYDHSSDLLTLQEIFGVGPCLGGACTATDLSDLYQAGAVSTPVPEPVSLSLFAAGLLGLGIVRGRKRVAGAANAGAPDGAAC